MPGRDSIVSPNSIIEMLTTAQKNDIRELVDTPATRYEACKSVEWNGELVVEHFWLAQLRHRYNIGDANLEIRMGVSRSEELAKYWKAWNQLPGSSLHPEPRFLVNGKQIPDLPHRIDGVNFRFAAAAIVSLSIRKEMSSILLGVVPKTSDFGDIANDFHYWNFTDAGLVEILQTGKRPRRWKEILEFATKRFRNTQIQDNFESYANLILKCQKEKWDEATEALKECERLYAKRPYHSGNKTYFEAWEVSPSKGPQGIDLRLAALIKYGFRKNPKLLTQIESVHKW